MKSLNADSRPDLLARKDVNRVSRILYLLERKASTEKLCPPRDKASIKPCKGVSTTMWNRPRKCSADYCEAQPDFLGPGFGLAFGFCGPPKRDQPLDFGAFFFGPNNCQPQSQRLTSWRTCRAIQHSSGAGQWCRRRGRRSNHLNICRNWA